MYLVVHNRSAVGFAVLHFVTIILDLNVEYVFLCTCALRANFGRFVTADYLKKNILFFRLHLSLSNAPLCVGGLGKEVDQHVRSQFPYKPTTQILLW